MLEPQHDNRVISNVKVAFGGITGGAPLFPYAFSGGIVNFLLPLTLIPKTPTVIAIG